MSTQNFRENLAKGKLGESKIASWLRRRGSSVIPIYEIELGGGKGPQVYTPESELVAPDLLVWKNGNSYWIEAKHKSVFTWHRKTNSWQTGIDKRNYEHYQRIFAHFGWDVWLLFLHESAVPDPRDVANGCPTECPTGLFGNTIFELKFEEDHAHDNWGRSGMVYWRHDRLRKLAGLEEL